MEAESHGGFYLLCFVDGSEDIRVIKVWRLDNLARYFYYQFLMYDLKEYEVNACSGAHTQKLLQCGHIRDMRASPCIAMFHVSRASDIKV